MEDEDGSWYTECWSEDEVKVDSIPLCFRRF